MPRPYRYESHAGLHYRAVTIKDEIAAGRMAVAEPC